ncbi:hypothetical protein [Thalassobius aquimarinus]|uniref:Peptidase M41 domain-containing protein n=1 Tax=Thalassovita aquimarina TaxID=2785917 RepID=A0ABS5HNR2_9RHOB|nr:hypothetical protein [Thalassovita aquimarina]
MARLSPTGGEVVFREPPFHTRATALARIRTLLAGHVAEELLFGAAASGAGEGPASDLAQATMLACKMETEFGFGKGGLVWQSSQSDRLIALIPWLRPRIQQHLSDASAQARAILMKKINAVELIATALIQERELKSERLEQLMSIQDALMSSFANEIGPPGTAAGTVIPFPKRGEG